MSESTGKDNRVPDFDDIVERLHREIDYCGSSVSYEVNIYRREKLVAEKQGDWAVVAEEEGSKRRYGYQPSRPVIETIETNIYSQIVNSVDLPEIVKAVNKIT
jgi:hypothetical protein